MDLLTPSHVMRQHLVLSRAPTTFDTIGLPAISTSAERRHAGH